MSAESLSLERKESLCGQIVVHVRGMIADGTWGVGARLPATEVLADMWRTSPCTVHRALVMLEREWLVVRRHGIGTFVRERPRALKTIGLYYRGSLSHPEQHFTRAVHEALKTTLQQRDLSWKIWVDERPEQEWHVPLSDVTTATRDRVVDAVVAPIVDARVTSWLTKLPVPVAVCGTGTLPNRVVSDYAQFVSLSLDALQQQGCTSVGLITGLSPATREQGGTRHEVADFFVRFVDAARDRGLELRSEWIVAPAHEDEVHDRGFSVERLGYEYASRLLKGAGRPDGLIVTDDIMARGVVTALLEQRVHVPDDLKLVLHKNEEVDLVCPFPAAFVVTRASDYAAALLDLVERQFRGESVEPVRIGWRLDMPGSTKQSAETRR